MGLQKSRVNCAHLDGQGKCGKMARDWLHRKKDCVELKGKECKIALRYKKNDI